MEQKQKTIVLVVDTNGNKMKKKLNFVDLFAGCGGLSLGLELAGFEPLFVNELICLQIDLN